MGKLWTYIEKQNWQAETKYQTMVFLLCILSALCGLVIWLPVHFFILSSIEWLICFMGYPAIAAWLGVFFYCCRHDFHDGKNR